MNLSLTDITLALAYGIAIWGGVMLAVIVLRHAFDWIDRRFTAPDSAPPVTVTPPEAVPTRVTLYVVPDPPHRPWGG